MKTAFVFTVLVVALLVVGNVAQASATNWMLYLAADSLDGTDFGVNAQIGVKSAASDGVDSYDGSPVDFGTSSNTTKWAVNSLADDAYPKNFMSTASYTTYPGEQKKWSFRVAGLTGSTGAIRFRFKTSTSTATAVPSLVPELQGYVIKLVNNRGMNVLRPSWAPNAGQPWVNGTMLELTVPSITSTYFGEIDLPLLKLSNNGNQQMLSEGYEFEFTQGYGDELTPEPSSLLALGTAIVGLAGLAIRRRKA